MPIHPVVASKFHLLEGIESFEAGLADPATRARLDEFMSITDAPFQESVLAQPLVHMPENVPVSPAALRRTLAEIRREGLATFRRRAPQPLVSVAAPIFGADDKVVAALSVVVPQENAEPRLLGPAVRTAARSISRGLGARRSIGHTGEAPLPS